MNRRNSVEPQLLTPKGTIVLEESADIADPEGTVGNSNVPRNPASGRSLSKIRFVLKTDLIVSTVIVRYLQLIGTLCHLGPAMSCSRNTLRSDPRAVQAIGNLCSCMLTADQNQWGRF